MASGADPAATTAWLDAVGLLLGPLPVGRFGPPALPEPPLDGGVVDALLQDLLDLQERLDIAGRNHTAGALLGVISQGLDLLLVPPWSPRRGELLLRRLSLVRTDGSPQESLACAEATVAACTDQDWPGLLLRALWQLAASATEVGDFQRSHALLDRAQSLALDGDDTVGLVQVLRFRSQCCQREGDMSQARALLVEALALLDGIDAPTLLRAQLARHLGTIENALGERERASELLADALRLFDRLDGSWGRAETRRVLASIAAARGDRTTGRRLAREALAIHQELSHTPGIVRCRNLLGELLREEGDLAGAATHYRDAIAVGEAAGQHRAALFPRINLAQVLQEQGDHPGARTLLEDGLVHAGLHRILQGWLHLLLLPSLEALGESAAWEVHYELGLRLQRETRAWDADIAAAWELSGGLALAAATPDEADGRTLSRGARALAQAWACWHQLGRVAEAARTADTLSRLSRRGAPIPVGDFDLLEPVGAGAMGEVWRALHRVSGEIVAIKVLTAQAARDPRVQSAFRGEVRAMAGLMNPHVARVLGQGTIDEPASLISGGVLVQGSPYLAMEHAAHGTLAAACGKLDWDAIHQVLVALLDGLAHSHARGVIHRDLKPANVLLAAGGDLADAVRLADFGLAAAVGRGEGMARTVSGSPPYMAPEQFTASWRDQGPWTDLYALGCLSYELLQGTPPFTAPRWQDLQDLHRHAAVPRLRPTHPVPEGLQAWLDRLLAKVPTDRFLAAADAAVALAALGPAVGDDHSEPLVGPAAAELSGSTWFFDPPASAPLPLDGDPGLPAPSLQAPPLPAEPPREVRTRPLLAGAGASLFGLRTPRLTAREPEREALWTALKTVHHQGRAQAVLLRGAAGVGRSRLGHWFAEKVRECGGAFVLEARPAPGEDPAAALRGLLVPWLGVADLDAEGVRQRLSRVRVGGLPLDPELVHAVLAVLGHVDAVDGTARRQVRHALALELIRQTARRRPVLVWLDDVQWGAETLSYVAEVLAADRSEPCPVLFVLAAQDEALAEQPQAAEALARVAADPVTRTLQLAPLTLADLRELLVEVVGLERGLAERLAQRAEGSPQLALHLVADWVERGLLTPGPDGAEVRPGHQVQLPEGLLQVWSQRAARVIERVGGQAREALELAALLGMRVDDAVLAAAAEHAELTVPVGLVETLLDLHLARPTPTGWAFTNTLLRESLDDSARAGDRAGAWHRACAAALADRPGAALARGRHALLAGEPGPAFRDLMAATRQLCVEGAHAQAQHAASLAWRALDGLGRSPQDRGRCELMVVQLEVLVDRGDFRAGRTLAEQALAATRQGGHEDLIARTCQLLGTIDRHLGNTAGARAALTEALALAERRGDLDAITRAHRALGALARAEGDLDRAWDHLQRCVALQPVAGAAESLGTWFSLGAVAWARGDPETAEALFQRSLTLAEGSGNRTATATVLNGLADLARARGDHTTAEQGYRRAMKLHRETSSSGVTLARLNLGQSLLAQGRVAEARDHFDHVASAIRREGRAQLFGVVGLAQLACDADTLAAAAWDPKWAEALNALAQTGMVDPDLAQLAELAGDRALAGRRPHRARQAWVFAVDHYARAGRPRSAEALATRLQALPSPSESG